MKLVVDVEAGDAFAVLIEVAAPSAGKVGDAFVAFGDFCEAGVHGGFLFADADAGGAWADGEDEQFGVRTMLEEASGVFVEILFDLSRGLFVPDVVAAAVEDDERRLVTKEDSVEVVVEVRDFRATESAVEGVEAGEDFWDVE